MLQLPKYYFSKKAFFKYMGYLLDVRTWKHWYDYINGAEVVFNNPYTDNLGYVVFGKTNYLVKREWCITDFIEVVKECKEEITQVTEQILKNGNEVLLINTDSIYIKDITK